jgi:co-chaperonin GroES (HSP10)
VNAIVKEPTALEKKWAEEAAAHVPSLEDAYTAEGLKPDKLHAAVLNRIPTPTGWRIAILPYRGAEKTKGGIALAEETQRKQQVSTVCGYVLKVGPIAYGDEVKFPTGPWCKEGDFVLTRPYSGTRVVIHGREFRIINDDTVEAVVQDPRGIRRA